MFRLHPSLFCAILRAEPRRANKIVVGRELDHPVMLSVAKHLDAHGDRPFAAAQGDMVRRLRVKGDMVRRLRVTW